MSKTKHNKKRNTAFLYEALIRDLTKSVLERNNDKKKILVSILKEHFRKDSLLAKELELYKTISEATNLPIKIAERLVQEVKLERSKIDNDKLFGEQTGLIKKINKNLGKDVYANFVPHYKSLATIAQLFSTIASIKKRVILEEGLIKHISSKEEAETMSTVDNVVYSSFVKRFNDAYVDLCEEQKRLLGTYIASFGDNGLHLKVYLNEEISRLKTSVARALETKDISEDSLMVEKTKKVLSLLEGFKDKDIDARMLKQILKIQRLVREVEA
jgi:hypothetical protein